MRKRRIYQQNKKPKSHIPTIIIMSVALFVILYFGKGMSDDIAGFFAPSVPVTDDMAAHAPSSSDSVDDLGSDNDSKQNAVHDANPIAPRCGTIMASASKNAAQKLLNIIAKGTTP